MSEAQSPVYPDTPEAEERLRRLWSRPPGFLGWLAVVNNRPLGVRYMVTSLVFFAIGGVLSLLLRAQLTVSENDLLGPELFNQLFTMHGSTMMYLFAVPFIEGLAMYMVPLMIGSRDLAFPRLSSFGYWLYLAGGLIIYASFLFGRAPDAGWFAYTPLSGAQYSDVGLDFWLLGLSLVEVAGLSAAAEIVVTILKFRAPGMALHRMPLLVWAYLIAGVMIIFGFTPLLLATFLLELDRTAGFRFFDPEYGGSTLLWQHLFWFFGHPEVYIIFIPATGVVSTIVPTFARRPLVGYSLLVVALMIIGFVSFGLWVHHMFTTGIPTLSLVFFAAASFMVAIGSGAQIFAWIATLWGSRPRYGTPLLYVLGFIFIFVIGGMTGVMVATVPFDWQVHDTYFVVAHFHYVLIGGAVFPIFAGLYYWLPKISGRLPVEPWGKIGFWLAFIGFNVTFFPMHLMGFYGMARRVYTYPAELNLDTLNIIATVGAGIVGLGFALAFLNLLWSAWVGPRAGADPWEAGTLEWSTSSPPVAYSFRRPPVVRGLYPLWRNDAADADAAKLQAVSEILAGGPLGWRANVVTDALNGRPQGLQALPSSTLRPMLAAMVLVATAVALLLQAYITAVAVGAMFVVALWFWARDSVTMPRGEVEALQEAFRLPLQPTGTASTAWWGTVSLLAMLATALGALVYSYFYLWIYSESWPQGGLPLPRLIMPSLACGALVLAAGPLGWAAWSRRLGIAVSTRLGLMGYLVLGLVYLGLATVSLATMPDPPTSNAYASASFALNGFALLLTGSSLAVALASLVALLEGELRGSAANQIKLEVTELYAFSSLAMALLAHGVASYSPHLLGASV